MSGKSSEILSKEQSKNQSEKPATVDFGASTAFGSHIFQVEIPASRHNYVTITENYGYRGLEGAFPVVKIGWN
jgi:hypothetical protein